MNKIIFILMMFILFLLVFVLLAKIIGIGFAGNLDAPMYFFSWKEIWDYKYVFCISSAFCSLFISLLYFDVKQKKEKDITAARRRIEEREKQKRERSAANKSVDVSGKDMTDKDKNNRNE
ncbi:MAG: hypothetical protein EOM76_02805 [Sphingobacteriia bacterium]|nr:hypothetical protein [Sphingobacteriia bacterium]